MRKICKSVAYSHVETESTSTKVFGIEVTNFEVCKCVGVYVKSVFVCFNGGPLCDMYVSLRLFGMKGYAHSIVLRVRL